MLHLLFFKGNIIFSNHHLSFTALLMYVFGKIWLYDMYGKHIQEIEKLVAEFNDEENDSQYDRSIIKIKNKLGFQINIKSIVTTNFGKYGNFIYGIGIGFIFMVLLVFILFLLGFLISYLETKYNFIQESNVVFLINSAKNS